MLGRQTAQGDRLARRHFAVHDLLAQLAVQPFMCGGVGVCDTRNDRHGGSETPTQRRVKGLMLSGAARRQEVKR